MQTYEIQAVISDETKASVALAAVEASWDGATVAVVVEASSDLEALEEFHALAPGSSWWRTLRVRPR